MKAATEEDFLARLDEHRRILWKVAGTYCRGDEDRRDLVQEIVVQLWRAFPRYDEQYRFSTWMYRIAMNVAISVHRSESRRTRDLMPFDEPLLEIAAPEPPSDESRLLHDWIAGLDALNKALVILYLDGNSQEEIAEVLGISATNVSTKINRLKQRLRRELGTK
jgi:RNA polymerase sigma factor (sigma-70 family)